MLKSYLISALRSMGRRKLHTFINIAGLTIGVACCIVIFLYVNIELSYDNFVKDEERVFRVLRESGISGEEYQVGVSSGPYAPAFMNDYPDLLESTNRSLITDGLVSHNDKALMEEHFLLSDPNFFQFFEYPILKGDPKTLLDNPNSIVVSEEMALKYFGQEEPLGKEMMLDNDDRFIVTGVFQNEGYQSHLQPDFVASLRLVENAEWFNNWWNNGLYTYLKIKDQNSLALLADQTDEFMDKYFYNNPEYKISNGPKMTLYLQPVRDAYFDNQVRYDNVKHGDRQSIYIFSSVAVFILLLACINFMNLSTAKATERAREIGLRKTIGASRFDLICQFLGESILITAFSVILALVLIEAIIPSFNNYFQLNLEVNYRQPILYASLIGFTLFVGLLAGLYPAFILASLNPVKSLGGKLAFKGSASFLRKSLVVAQFSISVILVVATMMIVRQLNYIQSKDLGFKKDNVLILRLNNSEIRENLPQFITRLDNNSNIISYSTMSGEPGGFFDSYAFNIEEQPENKARMRVCFADFDYAKTLGLEVIAGRDFSRDHSTDKNEALFINETAAKELGWSPQEAVGKHMLNDFTDTTYSTIVGVLKDFNFSSLHQAIEPLVVFSYPNNARTLVIKISGNPKEAIATIETGWKELSPSYPININFLDQQLGTLYQREQMESSLLSGFAGISILVAGLGLFGLSAFTSEQRKKEIGVRKVLGATIGQVVALLSKEFMILISIAFIIAIPVAYWMVDLWLQDFTYRTSISPFIFIVAAIITFAVAWLTMSYNSIKAAIANPVDSLKSE